MPPVARALKPRSIELLEKVMLGSSGIERRHFCTDALLPIFDKTAQTLSETYEREARALGARALSSALEKADVRDVDALFVCTCTGYLCPGLSSHLAEETEPSELRPISWTSPAPAAVPPFPRCAPHRTI